VFPRAFAFTDVGYFLWAKRKAPFVNFFKPFLVPGFAVIALYIFD
jgi:hypothetical protein